MKIIFKRSWKIHYLAKLILAIINGKTGENRDNQNDFESPKTSRQLLKHNKISPLKFYKSKLIAVIYCNSFKVYDIEKQIKH